MKKYRKLNLRKLSIAKLLDESTKIVGGKNSDFKCGTKSRTNVNYTCCSAEVSVELRCL